MSRGININPAYFNPSKEWELTRINNFDSLGSHVCNCNKFPAGFEKTILPKLVIHPNPADGFLNVSARAPWDMLVVEDLVGKRFYNCIMTNAQDKNSMQINTTSFPSGSYLIKLYCSAGGVSTAIFIIP